MIEIAPIIGLIVLCAVLTVQAGPVMRFIEATAEGLYAPANYIGGVLPDLPPVAEGESR